MSEPPRRRSSSSAAPDTRTLAALGKAAGEVAHDIDNALTAIVTHASLIRSEGASASARAHAEAILRAARAAAEVVERVRARLRAGGDRRRAARIGVDALVQDALVVARARARPRGIGIELSGSAPGAVAGQPAELLQLVTNLVNNAIDASAPHDTITVTLGGDDGVEVVIADRGAGIPAALGERVFEPFFTTKGAGGTGLGLALARSIAESHGGSLRLESQVHGADHGTRAIVWLPLADPGDDLDVVGMTTALELDGIAKGARVLLVDDDGNMREALGVLLTAAGFEVTTAAGPDEALAAFSDTHPEVVISDLQLGERRGTELVRALADEDPSLPIIVVSGALGAEQEGDWRAAVAAVFDKPVSPQRLIAKVRELVASRRATEEDRA